MTFLSDLVAGTLPGLTRGVRTALPYLKQLSFQGHPISGEALRAYGLGGIAKQQPVLSANAIIRTIRSAGFAVNTQQSLQVIKAYKSQAAAHTYINSLPDNIRPLASRVPLATSNQQFKYHAVVMVTGYDNLTGDFNIQYVTVTSTRLMTKAQIKSDAFLALVQNESYNMIDLSGGEVVTYTKANPSF